MNSVDEDRPGPQWYKLFQKAWPHYRRWFLSEGYRARPGYLTSFERFSEAMPELVPTYEELIELVGGGDIEARFFAQFCPPPYLTGCSQVIWLNGAPALIRNYDYSPVLFEGMLLKSNWVKPVIGMSDCLWGVLDGMNDSGLVVSLTFGGRKVTGEGFGIPLVLRYVLETCNNVAEGVDVLKRTPVHMAYNIALLDQEGNHSIVYLSPDRDPEVSSALICTNHQQKVEWEDYARATGTVERMNFLEQCLYDPTMTEHMLTRKFLQPPLYNTNYEKAFGTLYTAVYRPQEKQVELIWPGKRLKQSFDHFEEGRDVVNLRKLIGKKLTL